MIRSGSVNRPKRYGTLQAAKVLGVSEKSEKKIGDVGRDHRTWRVFTETDIRRIEKEAFGNAQKSRSAR